MAVTGDLGGNPIILENAAEEATLERLVELFETKFADNSGIKKDEAKATKDSTKATMKYMDTVEKTGQTVKSSFKQITESGEKLGDALQSLAGPGIAAISGMGKAGRIAGVGLTGLVAGVAATIGAFDKTGNMFLNLTRSGASFGGSMIEMRAAANRSGATMDQFTKAVQNNSAGLARFGGGTTNGAMALSRISAEGTRFRRQLVGMGVSVNEQTEFFADFASSLSRSGTTIATFGGDFAAVAKVSINYRKNLQQLSELTGRSAKEQEDARKSLEKNAAFQATLATLGPDAQSSLQALMASSDASTQQLIMDRVLLGGLGPKTAAVFTGMDGLVNATFDTVDAALRGEQNIGMIQAQNLDARAGQIKSETKQAAESARLSGSIDNQFLSARSEMLLNTREYTNAAGRAVEAVNKAQQAQEKAAEGSNRDLNTLASRQESMQKLAVAFEMLGTKLVDSGVAQGLVDKFSEALTGMSNVVTDISKLDPKVLIGGMIAGPVIATAVAGVIAGIGGKLGSGIMGLFGTGGKAAAGALGVGGGAAAKGLTTMSMALKSVGLGAIKIVAGGGAIAAVILAIGGAIAGAAWLTGSTLPKLTSAMKGIEELDGDRLVSAAKGLTAVSAAMAVMGGGSAVGAIGGLVSKIVSGGDSPADMLTNMAGAVDDFADAIDKLDLAKMTMLAGFVVPGAGELAELVQDATGGGAAATSGTATNTTTSSSDSTALLQRLLDVQTRQGTETNDLLRRISNDI
jgi:hypothetical protein